MLVLQFKTRATNPSAHLIKWVTWSQAYHVDAVLTRNQVIGSVLFDGISCRPLDSTAKFVLYPDAPKGILAWLIERRGSVGYGIIDLFGFPFRTDKANDPEKMFCSEAMQLAAQANGYEFVRRRAFKCSPNHIYIDPRGIDIPYDEVLRIAPDDWREWR